MKISPPPRPPPLRREGWVGVDNNSLNKEFLTFKGIFAFQHIRGARQTSLLGSGQKDRDAALDYAHYGIAIQAVDKIFQ
jgi:hypothetical protein